MVSVDRTARPRELGLYQLGVRVSDSSFPLEPCSPNAALGSLLRASSCLDAQTLHFEGSELKSFSGLRSEVQ